MARGAFRRKKVRIAVLSDIHGNLLALDAVMTDIESHSPDEIWCGGDVGWGGPWGSECIARVRDAGWSTVRGNTDVWITGDPQTLQSESERRELAEMAAQHDISTEDSEWLLSLPLGHAGPGGILLVHGTPDSPFDAPAFDAPAGDFAPFEGQASIIVYGHVHQAFVRRLSDGTIVVNTGAVGIPKDGTTASYLLIDSDGSQWTFRHRRVEFDRRAAIAQAKRMGGLLGERFVSNMGA